MAENPTYKELEKRVKELEEEIVELDQTEKALQESEYKYYMLFEKMLDGCALHEIICDADGRPVNFRYLAVNPAFEKLTGFMAGDILGKTLYEIIPDAGPFWVETYGKVALTGEPISFDHYTQDADRHFRITAYQPKKGQFACIFEDVTEQKKAEEGLKQSQEYLRTLMENTSEYIMISDKDGFPIIYNSAYAKAVKEAFGIDMRPGLKPHKLLSDKKAITLWDNLHKRILSGEKFKKVYSPELSDKEIKHLEISFNPIIQNGKVQGFTELARDITERREMEKALKRAHDELEKRVRKRTKELKKANKALNEKTKTLEDVNTALKVLLERRDKDKEELGEKVLLNAKELLIPYINKLKKGALTESQESYIELLESGLQEIISPFAQKLTSRYMHITPGEMQVANLVKEGKTSKEIAEILISTERAVVAHRSNLRKKLGLKKKSNLRTYLLSLQ